MNGFETPTITGRDVTPSMLMNMVGAIDKADESAIAHSIDVPIAARATSGGVTVAEAYASDIRLQNKWMHAEVLAAVMAALNAEENDPRLSKLSQDDIITILENPQQSIDSIFVTLEPCAKQCVDMLAKARGLQRIYYALDRSEASNRGIIAFHEQSAADYGHQQGHKLEIVQLVHPIIQPLAEIALDFTDREPGVDHVKTSSTDIVQHRHHAHTNGLGLLF